MDRAEAEAIYDSGRERCVDFILELVASVERLMAAGEVLEERVRRLELQTRQDSRTSSKPPSQDPPKTRQQRRAEARAMAKQLLARDGAKRKPAGGHFVATSSLSAAFSAQRPYTALSAGLQGVHSLARPAVDSRYAPKR